MPNLHWTDIGKLFRETACGIVLVQSLVPRKHVRSTEQLCDSLPSQERLNAFASAMNALRLLHSAINRRAAQRQKRQQRPSGSLSVIAGSAMTPTSKRHDVVGHDPKGIQGLVPADLLRAWASDWLLRHGDSLDLGTEPAGPFDLTLCSVESTTRGVWPIEDARDRLIDFLKSKFDEWAQDSRRVDNNVDIGNRLTLVNDLLGKSGLAFSFTPYRDYASNFDSAAEPALAAGPAILFSEPQLRQLHRFAKGEQAIGDLWTVLGFALVKLVWSHLGCMPPQQSGPVSKYHRRLLQASLTVLELVAADDRRTAPWNLWCPVAAALLAAFKHAQSLVSTGEWKSNRKDPTLVDFIRDEGAALPAAFDWTRVHRPVVIHRQLSMVMPRLGTRVGGIDAAKLAVVVDDLARMVASELTDIHRGFARRMVESDIPDMGLAGFFKTDIKVAAGVMTQMRKDGRDSRSRHDPEAFIEQEFRRAMSNRYFTWVAGHGHHFRRKTGEIERFEASGIPHRLEL
jgi:hypothetical protein